ncbi:hypothetical protein ACF0H5_008325 [Mactra antiquata]
MLNTLSKPRARIMEKMVLISHDKYQRLQHGRAIDTSKELSGSGNQENRKYYPQPPGTGEISIEGDDVTHPSIPKKNGPRALKKRAKTHLARTDKVEPQNIKKLHSLAKKRRGRLD